MRQVRRTVLWGALWALLTASVAACGRSDNLDADGPPPSRRRFPAAVVSTTTPDTTPFGQPVKGGTTTTTRPGSATGTTSRAATSTTQPAGPSAPPATPLPTARTAVAGTAWQGVVVVAGGTASGGGTSSRVDSYDPKTGTWSKGPNLPVPLHSASLAALGDDLWVVGGFTTEGDQSVAQTATYVFRAGADDWQPGPSLNTARGGAGATTLGNFLVVLGGQTTDGGILDTVEVLAKTGTEWKLVQPMSTGRAYVTALTLNSRIFAIGGRTPTAGAVDTVESWRSGSGGWRNEARIGSERRAASGAGSCVAGGENEAGIVKEMECYGTGFWTTVGQMDQPRYGLAVVALDGWFHLIGGTTAGGSVTNTHEVIAAPA